MTFEVRNGCFGYAKNQLLLKDISFVVRPSSVTSVLGPNGAGKTTLLKCMLGFLRWSCGDSYIDNKPIREMKHTEFWQRVGYVPQAKLSVFAYTVMDMTLLGRGAHLGTFAKPRAADVDIALACLKKIGIFHLRDKLCSRISGGELQMALIARALASHPKLLILDEPESNLDFKNQLIVMNTIRNLRDEFGLSSLVNTHFPEHALSISNDSVLLDHGGTMVSGPARNVLTEENLQNAFGVTVKIHDISVGRGFRTCVLPIAIA